MKKILFLIVLVLVIATPFITYAAPGDCNELKNLFTSAVGNDQLSKDALATFNTNLCTASDVILFVINLIFGFSGSIAVLMIVYGGFRYVISRDDATEAENAKRTIQYAVTGVAVILLAFSLVTITTKLLTGGGTVNTGGGTTPNAGGGNGGNTGTAGNDSGGGNAGTGGGSTGGGNQGSGGDTATGSAGAFSGLATFTKCATTGSAPRCVGQQEGFSIRNIDQMTASVEYRPDEKYLVVGGSLFYDTNGCAKSTRTSAGKQDCAEKYMPHIAAIMSTDKNNHEWIEIDNFAPGNCEGKKCKEFIASIDAGKVFKMTRQQIRANNLKYFNKNDDSAIYIAVGLYTPKLDSNGNPVTGDEDVPNFLMPPGLMRFQLK